MLIEKCRCEECEKETIDPDDRGWITIIHGESISFFVGQGDKHSTKFRRDDGYLHWCGERCMFDWLRGYKSGG